MNWKVLCTLAVLFTVLHYGPMLVVYSVVALGCFLLGLLFSMDREMFPDIFQKRKCTASKGIPAVTAIMDAEGVAKADTKISSSLALDVVCNQIISYILRDYIYSWYAPLTPDTVFPTELHRLLQQITANLVKRVSQVNWIPFLTETLFNDLASHVRLYRTMLEQQKSTGDKDHLQLFFDCETEAEKTICRENICTSDEQEKKYLRRISETLLFFILPNEEYRVPAIRYIARELLVSTVLVPTINLLSDPDFVNRSVAWFTKDNAFTSEYFIQALKMSDSPDELEVVVQQTTGFTEMLRGRDTGGDDDLAIKAQLGSLDYLRKICAQRLEEIKEGVMEKPEAFVYNVQPGTKLYDMSFKELMSKSVALVSFLDFLTSVGKHHLLRLYLNCVSYRDSAQNLTDLEKTDEGITSPDPSIGTACDLIASSPESTTFDQEPDPVESASNEDNLDTSGAVENDDVFGLSDVHVEDFLADTASVQSADCTSDSLGMEQRSESPKPTDMVQDLRAFGVLLCGNLLKQLPTSAEPLIQQVLRTLTIGDNPPDPNAFVDVEAKLTEMLSDAQCFGAFKKSSQYVQLLAELDLLKDTSDQADPQSTTESQSVSENTSDGLFGPMQSAPSSKLVPTSLPVSTSAVDSFLNIFKISSPDNESRTCDTRKASTFPITAQTSTPSETYTAEIIRTEIMRDSYVVYTIRVTCMSTATGSADTWQTLRRFSHFAELHSLITDRCGNIPKLKLPSKRAFSNMSRDFLNKRRRELDEYLTTLCDSEFLTAYPAARAFVVEFLQPDSWERSRLQARRVTSLLNPLRTVSNAMKAMPDTLADGFSRMFPGLQGPGPLDRGYRRSASFDTTNVASFGDLDALKVGGYPMDSSPMDDSPIGKLFLLVDEIFNLHQKNHLSREGNFVILRKIFHPLFGPRVNKMIISKVREYTNANQIAELLAYLRDSVWPPTDSTQPPKQPLERSREIKLRTRVLCRTMLLGSLSEELAQFLGHETTRRGAARVFRLIQQESLNRRFVHHLLQAIILHLFKPCEAQWEAIFEKHLCPLHTGRACRIHNTIPE
ncbi:sorting nexin 13 [Clonorchis sinensis]|uniref:Sorting nexin 13 n=1 Tax=Clonorchis sinensis TaxID=79923 RepID=A0A8T1MPS8_CLOSI|nr:sorting nexin 13 [Clonorchis sinensis]